eukprot:7231-Heterococcus_DN1.PRE.4
MGARLEEVLRLRTTHEELLRLLTREEARQLGASGLFEPFTAVAPLRYNPYTEPQWRAAVAEFERCLAPIEQTVAANFKRRVEGMLDRPQLLLREFQRCASLIQRPRIGVALASEREILLQQLTEHLNAVDASFDDFDRELQKGSNGSSSTAAAAAVSGKNMSKRVRGVVHCRVLNSRCRAMRTTAAELLSDLSGFKAFSELADELVLKAARQEASLVEEWREGVEDMLDSEGLSDQLRGKLMDINKAGLLEVNYSERLVTLLREVRQLAELGHAIPSRVAKAAGEGERYYRYGVMLKKVANFYNNVEAQIIDAQKPMLLDALLAFEESFTSGFVLSQWLFSHQYMQQLAVVLLNTKSQSSACCYTAYTDQRQ